MKNRLSVRSYHGQIESETKYNLSNAQNEVGLLLTSTTYLGGIFHGIIKIIMYRYVNFQAFSYLRTIYSLDF